ncbi:hypothetical protein A3762_13795 [Oleiphilus sp. HI0125]|uniref:GIY-YIG nuclease family protein n=1 Tax=Oleiphilus sp. HI0125 TaxID=1822266 RepID=UPI0007C40D96|nr:GIY-YIG nuclease family protein [Oleiphilus sp. HI0125]KZZ57440.1 hypothetical protein A3762_19760 [Oleiphilus sp. HI0125]KZZ62014.1 hypothetical protein A3762_13795 [Oleiphilus sp. HI0125]
MREHLGIVYVLTNPAMPGLVKIGKTSRASVDARLSELYTTGVPVPFECAFAGRVDDEHKVERAFHQAFGPYRLNLSREFFEIEADQAIALLELLVVEDVTPSIQAEADAVDKESESASKRLKSRRPVINYLDIGIPESSILRFYNNEAECEVISGRQVRYQGEDLSLTALTKRLLDTDRPLQPARYWYYQGRNLLDIYHEACDQM